MNSKHIMEGHEMLDLAAPAHGVEIEIGRGGDIVWVNIDGVCALRISSVNPVKITINDARSSSVAVERKGK